MKYIRLTFGYLSIKKWLVFLLLALVPAISFIFYSSELPLIKILTNYNNLEFSSFNEIINILFGRMNWLVFSLLILVDAILLSFMIGTIDRDMRLGDFKLQHFKGRVNFNIITSLTLLISITVIFYIYKILVTSLFLLWIKINTPIGLLIVLFILSAMLLFLLLMLIFTIFFLAPPLIVSGGRRITVALSESILYVRDKIVSIFFALLFPTIIKFIITQILSLMGVTITIIFEILFNMFFTVYIAVLMFATYYDILDIDRMDKKNKIKW